MLRSMRGVWARRKPTSVLHYLQYCSSRTCKVNVRAGLGVTKLQLARSLLLRL